MNKQDLPSANGSFLSGEIIIVRRLALYSSSLSAIVGCLCSANALNCEENIQKSYTIKTMQSNKFRDVRKKSKF